MKSCRILYLKAESAQKVESAQESRICTKTESAQESKKQNLHKKVEFAQTMKQLTEIRPSRRGEQFKAPCFCSGWMKTRVNNRTKITDNEKPTIAL